MLDVLPNADNAVIPMENLLGYYLNFSRDSNKTIAFKLSLGYTTRNADRLVDNIRHNLRNHKAVFKGNNGYGDIYEVVMSMTGENGKNANVLTAWIIENDFDYPRLTNVYVTKEKAFEVTRMKLKMYQKVHLHNGTTGVVIEIFNDGEAFMIDIMTEDGEYEQKTIYPKDIKSVIMEVERPFIVA